MSFPSQSLVNSVRLHMSTALFLSVLLLFASQAVYANVISSVARDAAEVAARAAAKQAAINSAKNAKGQEGLANGQQIELAKFQVKTYTKNFTKPVKFNLSGFLIDEGAKKKFDLEIDNNRGRKGEYEKKSWIVVEQKGTATVGDTKVTIALNLYYDVSTGLLTHQVYLDDGNVDSYMWSNYPSSVRLGEIVKVGKVFEKDSKGKLLAAGDVELSSRVVEGQVEICQINRTKSFGKPQKNTISQDCERFTREGTPTKNSIEIQENGKTTSFVEGTLVIKE
jgi:hypothetical protein